MPENQLLQAALSYAELGLKVFPCRPRQKAPLTKNGCHDATTDSQTIHAWWERWPEANIGLHCENIFVVDIDYHPTNGIDGWEELKKLDQELPDTIRQNTPTGGMHYLLTADTPPANKNSFRKGIDIRGKGYYILLAPSIHPNGGKYEWVTEPYKGGFATFPDFMRPENEKVTPPWKQQKTKQQPPPAPKERPKVEEGQIIERARSYLQEVEPAIQGQAGHDSLLWATTAMVHGFQLDDPTALQLLEQEYNPRCEPPWDLNTTKDKKDFERKVSEARKLEHSKPAGWLLDEYGLREDHSLQAYGQQLADSLIQSVEQQQKSDTGETAETQQEIPQKKPPEFGLPDDLLEPPGLVGDLARWMNATARKPQPTLSLGAALALVGTLLGRKVADEWDLRTNMYVLGVAPTCAGKEHQRTQIKRLLEKAGVRDHYLGGEDVTSDAAIESTLETRRSCLYLWDEIGHLISNMKSSTSQTHLKTIIPCLMKLYSSANSTYVGKEYADGSARRDVVQPNVSIYGTTVPETLYEGITSQELRDGFLGRVLVFPTDDDPEPDDERAKIAPVPEHLIQQIQAWHERRISAPEGVSDIEAAQGVYQLIVPTQNEAQQRFIQFRNYVREQKQKAAERGDGTDCLWGRAEEHARKIALTIASGDRFDHPEITEIHADRACRLIDALFQQMINAVQWNISDNSFERDKKRILEIVKKAGPKGMPRAELTKRTQKFTKKQRDEYISDLEEACLIVAGRNSEKKHRRWVWPYPYGLSKEQAEQQDGV